MYHSVVKQNPAQIDSNRIDEFNNILSENQINGIFLGHQHSTPETESLLIKVEEVWGKKLAPYKDLVVPENSNGPRLKVALAIGIKSSRHFHLHTESPALASLAVAVIDLISEEKNRVITLVDLQNAVFDLSSNEIIQSNVNQVIDVFVWGGLLALAQKQVGKIRYVLGGQGLKIANAV